ncbi:hypothetical protein PR001_g13014 [Phytophthora rubi]|uniref:Integrase catalytic domain-containing protein n=1 Tax=Phytophthora rubi TaxID=129364 RepID=A0A6A3LUQ4_9STRA|nr:hypothetical protein PR001_g13014 [Phytophthora rubi]
MSADDKELLLKVLRNYPTLLEPRTGCPPMTTLDVEHEIHTGNEAPIKVRPRRHAHEEQKVIDEQVASMLNDGVIEPSSGVWGFPVVLVKKKVGSVRFCIDYRLLNAITKKDVYLLPRIDETLDNLHGARRFTSLDLHAGYWQAPVAAADRDKTGFVTRQGLFRFIRMHFGLANAPETFQRMMNATLRGLTWQSCLVYLDDVIVFSKGGMERHVVELAAVMERLANAGFSLKASMCSFATERLGYLGHELDADGVRPMPSFVHSVQEFPVPTGVTELKRFVHRAGYYRRWGWELPTQDQGQGEQPVAYASKINSPTVAEYSISDLECAAAVWTVKLFRPYLYGRKFELVTDHAALKWLMTSKDLTGRLHRWSLQLQEYNFEVVYRPGASNVVADALSRAPVRAVIGREEEAPPAGGEGQLTDETICQEQTSDRMVKNLRRKGKHGSKAVVVENEIVYIVLQDGSKRVVLPTALWASALRESHDSVYSCHLRTPQTYARIAATYWWPDMNDHVRRTGAPGDRWALDVAGPLQLTSGGNRYVIAAVDYATRYSVVAAVPNHTAKDVANFIAEKLVFVFGRSPWTALPS